MIQTSLYKDALTNSMTFLGQQPNTVFIGQQVLWHGNPMSTTIGDVPKEKMIETPVMEETQLGMSLGLAMAGHKVVTFYPRWDFLICASNQLVNHLDKIEYMSKGTMRPRVIIRTSIGPKSPLDGGPQHTADYTQSFKDMLTNTRIVSLNEPEEIFPAFEEALLGDEFHSTLLIENGAYYNDK